jgi:uncharacterized BrkB/YihY/UPF0761 family membrane protein
VSWLLVVCVLMFAIVLSLRVAAWRKNPQQSSWKKRFKLARILVIALLALMAIVMRMTRLGDSIDGKPKNPPTLVERILDRY